MVILESAVSLRLPDSDLLSLSDVLMSCFCVSGILGGQGVLLFSDTELPDGRPYTRRCRPPLCHDSASCPPAQSVGDADRGVLASGRGGGGGEGGEGRGGGGGEDGGGEGSTGSGSAGGGGSAAAVSGSTGCGSAGGDGSSTRTEVAPQERGGGEAGVKALPKKAASPEASAKSRASPKKASTLQVAPEAPRAEGDGGEEGIAEGGGGDGSEGQVACTELRPHFCRIDSGEAVHDCGQWGSCA